MTILKQYYKDKVIRFKYNKQLANIDEDSNAIGPTSITGLRTLPAEVCTNGNLDPAKVLYVAKTGNNTTGDGTALNPYLTITYAVTKCTTAKRYILINDSETYIEPPIVFPYTGYISGIIGNIGCTPEIQPDGSIASFYVDPDNVTYQYLGLLREDQQKEIPVFTEDTTTYKYFYSAVVLSNGNIAFPYIRYELDSENSGVPYNFNLCCKIYDSSFTVEIANNVLCTISSISFPDTSNTFYYIYADSCACDDMFVWTYRSSDENATLNSHAYLINNDGTLRGSLNLGLNTTGSSVEFLKDNIFCTLTSAGLKFYNSTTLILTLPATAKLVYVDDNYFYAIDVVGSVATLKKVNASTLAFTSQTLTGAYWVYQGKIIKCNGSYIWIYTDSTDMYFRNFDFSTFTFIGQSYKEKDISDFVNYSYEHYYGTDISTLYLKSLKLIDDNKLIYAYHRAISEASLMKYYMVYNMVDMSLFGISPWAQAGTLEVSQTYFSTTNSHPLRETPFQYFGDIAIDAYKKDYNNSAVVGLGNVKIKRLFNRAIIYNLLHVNNNVNKIILSNITFNCLKQVSLNTIFSGISSGASIYMYHCEVKNIYNDTSKNDCFPSYAIGTRRSNKYFYNTKFSNIYQAFYGQGAGVNSIFSFIKGGVAVNGASVGFTNCTFFNNYAGVSIPYGANGTFLNCIIHNNSLYGISNAGSVSILNTCCTDTIIGGVLGANSISQDPAFKNEGYVDPALTNLHLKHQDLGDDITSPCWKIGTDGKNLGAYDSSILHNNPIYADVQISKPTAIKIIHEPINAVKHLMSDNTYKSHKDGFIETWSCTWKSLLCSDYEKLYDVVLKGGGVLIFFEPLTLPDEYYAAVILEDQPFMGSPGYFALSEYGVHDITINFAFGASL